MIPTPRIQGRSGERCANHRRSSARLKYSTYLSGKWHVTPKIYPGSSQHNWPRQRGFDRFYGTIHGAGSFFDPNSLTRQNTLISPAMRIRNMNRMSFTTPMQSMTMPPDSLMNTRVRIHSFYTLLTLHHTGRCTHCQKTLKSTREDTMPMGNHTGETLPKTIGYGADRSEVEIVKP